MIKKLVLLLALSVFLTVSSAHAAEMAIVTSGVAAAEIVIPELLWTGLAEEWVIALQTYINEVSGATLNIVEEADLADPQVLNRIHVGETTYATNLCPEVSGLKNDGFILRSEVDTNFAIIGPSDYGTEFGVYEFLEKYIGIRWLLPGDDGDYVPTNTTLTATVETTTEEPVFFSRRLTGQSQHAWVRKNKMHELMAYGHNLYKLFPPETYKVSNPEFFPIYDGERYVPEDNDDYHWQPCFSAAGLDTEAIATINAYFVTNPTYYSYSIGLNDGAAPCECATCTAKYLAAGYTGYTNISEAYFEWANAVAAGVYAVHPTKYLGVLGHKYLAEPPVTETVYPTIVTYLTFDYLKWADATIETTAKAVYAAWVAKSATLGIYDYIYGTPYCIPRIYNSLMGEYYSWAADSGVVATKAEAYPNFGEGPKLYLALKLMWDPTEDVDDLLDEWYTLAVGAAAAPYLEAYYDIWETYWTTTVTSTGWFQTVGTYLNFKIPDYLDSVKLINIRASRTALEAAVANTVTADQTARAQLMLDAFEYYEASVISYLGLELCQPSPSRADCLAYNQTRTDLTTAFESDEVLIHPRAFNNGNYNNLIWDTEITCTPPITHGCTITGGSVQ